MTRILTEGVGSYFNVEKMDLSISTAAGILTSSVLDNLRENSGLGLKFYIISRPPRTVIFALTFSHLTMRTG